MGPSNWKPPWNLSNHHSTILFWGLRRPLIGPILCLDHLQTLFLWSQTAYRCFYPLVSLTVSDVLNIQLPASEDNLTSSFTSVDADVLNLQTCFFLLFHGRGGRSKKWRPKLFRSLFTTAVESFYAESNGVFGNILRQLLKICLQIELIVLNRKI